MNLVLARCVYSYVSCKGENGGFTLVELILVVIILSVLAMVAVQRLPSILGNARMAACEHEMEAIRTAILGSDGGGGYLDDMGRIPGFSAANMRLAHLLSPTNFFDVHNKEVDIANEPQYMEWDYEAERGWRGPYVKCARREMPSPGDARPRKSKNYADCGFFPMAAHFAIPSDLRDEHGVFMAYGIPGEPAIFDPWGNPYVLQVPPSEAFDQNGTDAVRFRYARLVSAGPDGVLSTPCFMSKTQIDLEVGASSWKAKQRLMCLGGLLKDAGGNADSTMRGDDIVLFLNRADLYEEHPGLR